MKHLRPIFFLCIFVLSVLPVRAQFQQPTAEELKMTDDPQSPGAAATYLNIEEVANDELHFHSVYMRIKVLKEKGKELATVHIPYEHSWRKITDIRGRTIHADGTVIPMTVKPEDLLDFSKGDVQVRNVVFTLPDVQVGSILEFFFESRYDDNYYSSPQWEVQQEYPLRKGHYAFIPFKAFLKGSQFQTSMYLMDAHDNPANMLMWFSNLPQGAQVKSDAIGHLSVDVADVPAAPREEYMPPQRSFLYHVNFYYINGHDMNVFWQQEAKYWSKDVEHFAEVSSGLKSAVQALIAPADTETVKAEKLYKAVQSLDNTDYSREKSASELKQLKLKLAKHAEDVWKQKSGSSDQIAMLYLAMLRAAGISAYALELVDREHGLFDPSFMSTRQLDDTLVGLKADGKDLLADPGEKMCPFGTLSWRHSNAGGIRQPDGAMFAVSTANPNYTSNKLYRTADIDVDAQGVMHGKLQFTMTGQEALRWRQQSLRNDPEEVKKEFDKWIAIQVPEGIDAHLDHFLAIDDEDANLLAIVNATGQLGVATAKRVLLPGFFFASRGNHPFVESEKRQTAVDMQYPNQIIDQATYHLPTGLSVEGAPQDNKFSWPAHAVFNTKTVQAEGKVIIARVLSRGFTFAEPKEYSDLRGYYQKIAASDQQQLVLSVTAPKGN